MHKLLTELHKMNDVLLNCVVHSNFNLCSTMPFFAYKFRGRHASKITEEEEDEEYLKEEEDGLSGTTRLVTQPSCKCSLYFSFNACL